VAYHERTSSESALNHFKKAEEDMPAPPRKRGRPKKNPLPVNNSARVSIIHVMPDVQKGVNDHVARMRSHTGVKLPIGATKAKIVQKGVTEHVARVRTKIKLPEVCYADAIRTDIADAIRTDALNHYGESRKEALGEYAAKDQGGRKDHEITKD